MTPTINDVSTNCQNITFRLNQPHQDQRGVTYQWRINQSDVAGAVGPNPTISAVGRTFPLTIDVRASSNCAAPILSPSVTFTPSTATCNLTTQNQTVCQSEGSLSVNLTSNQCIVGATFNFNSSLLKLTNQFQTGAGSIVADFQILGAGLRVYLLT